MKVISDRMHIPARPSKPPNIQLDNRTTTDVTENGNFEPRYTICYEVVSYQALAPKLGIRSFSWSAQMSSQTVYLFFAWDNMPSGPFYTRAPRICWLRADASKLYDQFIWPIHNCKLVMFIYELTNFSATFKFVRYIFEIFSPERGWILRSRSEVAVPFKYC